MPSMENIVSWVATVATIVAACMTASNLGARITGYGFVVFTLGSVAWFTLGWLTNQQPLIWTNVVMTFLNLFGVWRWLGRQAKVEEGGRAAAAESENRPGETLFPVSLLTGARARITDGSVGTCVDAMAGCGSGKISYVVVSDGGVAGVGETLRRVPWRQAGIQEAELHIDVDKLGFERFETVQRDAWPAK